MKTVAAVVGAALLLCGCLSVDIESNPQTYSLKPEAVAHLRVAAPVALINGQADGATAEFQVHPSVKWVSDLKRLTDTAIVMLGTALEQRGVAMDAAAEKTVTLSVRILEVKRLVIVPYQHTEALVTIDAAFGDGTDTKVTASNRSPLTPQRAFDGAVLFALQELLADPDFVKYLQR